jgi:hypothetical protein
MVVITIVTGAYKPTYNWGASHCKNLTQTQNYGWFGVKDYGKVTLSLNRHPQEAGHTLMTNSLVSS